MNLPLGGAADSNPGPDAIVADESSAEPATVDRTTLDAIFGEVLPDVTGDERDSSDAPGFDATWYQDNRPPHHDR